MRKTSLAAGQNSLPAERGNTPRRLARYKAFTVDNKHNWGGHPQDKPTQLNDGVSLQQSCASSSIRTKVKKMGAPQKIPIHRETPIHRACSFLLLFAIFLLLSTSSLMAQTSLGTSSLGGIVRDPSSAAIPGAKVTLSNVQRGTTQTTTTSAQGEYQFNAIQPGLYSLRVTRKGFKPATVQNIKIVIDQAATVNMKLQIGTVSQQVVVNAAGSTPLLDTTSNAMGTVMGSRHVADLPLDGRNFLQLGQLVGGSQQPTGTSDQVTAQTGHSDQSISVTGANQFETSYLINGIETRGSRIGNSSLNESVAAIDQFKIDLGFFMPDLGPNSGIINVITKSGTNELHGEAYDYWRSDKLDATNYFSTQPGTLRRDQFGISLGGPIIIPRVINGHNKLWFFVNYEGTRQAQDSQQRGYTPTAAMMNGNFSAESSDFTIYNPYSYDATTQTRQPFPNNIIPQSLISPIAKKLLAYYLPGSSYTQRPVNLVRSVPSTLNDNQFTIRVDATLSSRQSLFGTVIHETSPVVEGGLMPLSGHSFPLEADLGSLQDTLTLGPNMVNIARIGFDRNSVGDDGEGESGPPLETQIGIPGTVDPHGIPNVAIQGFTGFGNPTGKIGNADDSYQFYDSLDISRGKHNFALGAGIVYTRSVQNNANANAVGNLSFAPIFTAQLAPGTSGPAPVAGTGNALADFLLGMPSTGTVVGFQPMHYRYTEIYPYFQDSWRLTRRFTVNYGISWYYATVPNPQGPDAKIPHDFNFTTGLLQYAALGQVSPQVINPTYKSFTPRLGFAWHPRFLGQTVLRTGAGLYYGQKGLLETQFTYLAPPFQASQSFSNSQFSPMPTYTFGNSNPATNVFPVLKIAPLTKTFAASLPQGFSPFAVNPDSKQPYTWQWTASIQHTIDRNDLVEIDYIGNSSHDQQNRYNADQCLVSSTNYCEPNTKPYPRYGFILYSNTNGNSSYEAMIVKYQHQTAWGLNLLANFQYSKTLSDSWETATGTVSQNAYCRSCDKGPVSYDIPHALTVSAVYDLPVGRGRTYFSNMPRPENTLLGGWRISAITTLQAGNPFTITSPNNTSSPFTQVRADESCSGADSYLRHHLRSDGFVYFKTSCFSSPAAGYFGNSPRGVLFGPGLANTDLGLAKDIPLYRTLKLELRGQFFNAFNHPNFDNPDSYTGDSTFGVITTASDPRILQIAGRFVW